MAGWAELLLGPGGGADLMEVQDQQPGAQMRPQATVRPGDEMPQRAAQPAPVRAQPQLQQPAPAAAPQPAPPQPQGGIKLAPGYSVRNMGERGDIPVIVDPDGRNVSELEALPEASAYAERALRRYGGKPPQEAIDAVNSYRRAIGQPEFNPAELQQQPQQAAPQQEAPARRSYADDLLGPSTPQTQAQPAARPQAPADPNAEPDAPSWLGRRVQAVRGKRDPRYADVPAYQPKPYTKEDDSYLASQLANVDDAGRGDIIAKQLGNRLLKREKDANGYEVITYRDDDGSTKQAYVNRPGLDMQDMSRTALGAVPYVAAAALTRGAGGPVGVQVGAQSIAAGLTSIFGDAAAQEMGSQQGVDLLKAGITAASAGVFTAAAPAVAAIWNRFVTVPGLIDKTTGKLTPKGAAAARQAGLDPADLDPQFATIFAKEMAKHGNPQAAARSATTHEFGIPRTMGELTQNPAQLLKEQRIRGGAYGESGSRQMQTFDKGQAEAIAGNLVGDTAPTGATGQTIAKRLAPDRTAADFAKGNMGQEVRTSAVAAREAARKAEGEAWDKVGTITATDQALADLPAAINRGLSGFKLNDRTTPVAAEMARDLEQFIAGKAPDKVASFLSANPSRDVDQMRRMLGNAMADMQPGPDRKAAGAIYSAFNDWIETAAGKMVQTNPQGAANLVTARGISREVKDAFATNPRTAGDKIMAQVLEKADSAENVINALFTGPTAQIKQGTVEALQSLKGAYDRYLPADAAQRAWNDVRLAYWLRLSQGKGGDAVGAQQFQTNLKTAMQTQGSVFRLLFSAEETAAMKRLAMAVAGVEMKNLNRSWTAPSVAGFMKEGFDALLKSIGWNTPIVQTAARTVGGPAYSAYGTTQATRATAQGGLAARRPPLLAPYAATAASRSED